ncbi:zinc finger protein 41-like [Pogonomyrmex barbatus]|uniref:Zinc finger protein 41-like n=1 Tax=Pogonomyrmex barbatus TaxID=144034 RepID=A0A8N1S4F6_9HYME|nr:zinc finger protein 41-like [Pogonomyrmex barbatus]
MKKWQILEFDGKPYYAFIPEGDTPLSDEDIPEDIEEKLDEMEIERIEEMEDENSIICDNVKQEGRFEKEEYDSMEEKYNAESILNGSIEGTEESSIKPIILNGISENMDDKSVGDLYQLKVQGTMVTIEKLGCNTDGDVNKENEDQTEDMNDDEGEIEYLDEELINISNVSPKPSNNASPKKKSAKNSNEALKCKLCSETFDTVLSFRKHVAWSHKKKMCIKEDGAYICAVCGFKTSKKNSFASHLERKHETWSRKRSGNTKFPCAACGFVCRSKHSLQSHFTRKHTDKYEYQCSFCSKKFKVKGDLTNHIRFHHKEKPVKCDVCGKLCLNSGSLYVHQKWAHYKPKYECHICKRRMVTQANLDQHLLSQHEKRDKIVCAECGKTFTKKDSFKRHMVVHTGCKPHACMICSKPFARRSQLRQHLLIHTGKRPFVCDICGKAFTQKPGLICHRKTHPGPHPPLPVMPIADIVKEFTDGYVQELNARENEERIIEEEEV